MSSYHYHVLSHLGRSSSGVGAHKLARLISAAPSLVATVLTDLQNLGKAKKDPSTGNYIALEPLAA